MPRERERLHHTVEDCGTEPGSLGSSGRDERHEPLGKGPMSTASARIGAAVCRRPAGRSRPRPGGECRHRVHPDRDADHVAHPEPDPVLLALARGHGDPDDQRDDHTQHDDNQRGPHAIGPDDLVDTDGLAHAGRRRPPLGTGPERLDPSAGGGRRSLHRSDPRRRGRPLRLPRHDLRRRRQHDRRDPRARRRRGRPARGDRSDGYLAAHLGELHRHGRREVCRRDRQSAPRLRRPGAGPARRRRNGSRQHPRGARDGQRSLLRRRPGTGTTRTRSGSRWRSSL